LHLFFIFLFAIKFIELIAVGKYLGKAVLRCSKISGIHPKILLNSSIILREYIAK
jgi:hypothetical protein